MISEIRKIPFVKYCIICVKAFTAKHNIYKRFSYLLSFLKDYRNYKKLLKNSNFKLSTGDLYPQIFDKTDVHGVDYVYLYQDSWCAGKVFETRPVHHYDVGSKLEMVGIISQFVPTTMIDIRSLNVSLPNLYFERGNILELPFKDSEIESLSSICVIEHIGLGRYGDPLDQFGSEKAAKELIRVLKKGGNLYVSVPVYKENIIYFNAHRTFTRDYILSLFFPLKLLEEKYIYGKDFFDEYDQSRGFGTGLFQFKKYD